MNDNTRQETYFETFNKSQTEQMKYRISDAVFDGIMCQGTPH